MIRANQLMTMQLLQGLKPLLAAISAPKPANLAGFLLFQASHFFVHRIVLLLFD